MTGRLQALKDAFRAGRLSKAQFIERMHEQHAILHDFADAIRGSDVAKIEITDDGVVMTSRAGVRFCCDPADYRIAPVEAINFGSYESDDAAMLDRLIQPGMVIFDIGANIGWYSLHHAARDPKCRLHAFEPIPSTLHWLERNLALNPLPNVTIHPFGFSDASGTQRFHVYPEGSGGASAANNSGRPTVQQVEAPVRTLDEFVEETRCKPDLLKVDVEGAELSVFRGGMRTLSSAKPIIFTEMLRKWSANFGYHPNDIIALLSGLGYGCFFADGDRLMPIETVTDDTSTTNFVFLHRDRHSALVAKWAGGANVG